MVNRRRFFNPAQPQTLHIAVILFYLNAVITLIAMFQADRGKWIYLLIAAGDAGAGFGIANEKKWGYGLGILMAFLPFALRFYFAGNPFGADLLNTMFEIALVALLLHPQSRDYQRIWFK